VPVIETIFEALSFEEQKASKIKTKRMYDELPRLIDMQINTEFVKLPVKVGDGHTMLYALNDNDELRKYIPVEYC
jgi:hypothetical protein